MEYRTLGRTGLNVSLLGMGTGGWNCLGQRHDPPVPEPDIHRLLHGVFDLGINLFDTAPGYLESEAILGRALRSLPRDQVVVSTKVSLVEGDDQPTAVTEEEITSSVEQSLQRLQLSEIDVLLIAVPNASFYDDVFDDQMEVIQRLQDQGKVRFIGSSERTRSDGSHDWLLRALPTDLLNVAMVGHNMINQSAQKSVFPLCLERDIGTMNIFTVRNVFRDTTRLTEVVAELKSQGHLTDDVDEQGPFDWLLDDPNVESLVEAAYRYAAYTPGVTSVMCGTITPEKVEQNIASLEKGPLNPSHISRLEKTFGHISEAIGN